MSAVKHEGSSKTTKEHPVRVGSQLHSNTSSQNHKDCRRKSSHTVKKDPKAARASRPFPEINLTAAEKQRMEGVGRDLWRGF